MLYNFLISLIDQFSALNVFRYLTFRTGLSVMSSMVIVFLIGGPFIKFIESHKITGPIREDGPLSHVVKKVGTPTMGGILILIGILFSTLLWADLNNSYIWVLLFVATSFGLLGALDDYLKIPYIIDVGEASIFCGSIVGSCLGFLWFNAPPAKIFMGDTGSLSLGGSLGAVSIISKHEIVLGIIGGLFVLETASVIIQVLSFKLTGKRVFMMAPLHHHFEKKGWAESTVVIRFWIISIILALIGLATLKLR